MDMLQRDGLLQPTYNKSHEKCKSCISGKMARKLFPHQVERAKDLLELIHTDVCEPFRTVSREGANYFITFIDDFSRYGFVYLMKHKHEVLETFKVFHNEVENQLDTQPSENTSEAHNKVAPIKVEPQNVGVPIRRSARIPQVSDRYGYYVDIAEYELGDFNEPPNYKVALADPESDKWLEAMNTEMQSMRDNQVWYLVDLPSNGRTVGCKWLFKKKTDMDGNVHTFKVRLVAKGFTQTYDVDYGETFSLVVDIRAIRILLAIVAFYDYEIWQMDVKTAFLNGHLSEDNKRFDEEIKKIGFTQNPDEPCVYLKSSGSNVAFLVLYVDDILLMGNNVTMLQEVKSCMCFSMKDLGEVAYILGIKIIRDRSKWLIALSQSAYLEKILKKFKMENSKKEYTPMMKKPDYRKSFETDKDDTKSQTGYVFILNGGSVDWKSAKQSTTAMYSIEAEYIVAAEASMEAVWVRKFIDGLGDVMPSNKRPMEMLCDNEPALVIASDPRFLKGARHF
ncbi:retrotransposon protein, putative, ty1-copia subclass [Tanacetum coccineum]